VPQTQVENSSAVATNDEMSFILLQQAKWAVMKLVKEEYTREKEERYGVKGANDHGRHQQTENGVSASENGT